MASHYFQRSLYGGNEILKSEMDFSTIYRLLAQFEGRLRHTIILYVVLPTLRMFTQYRGVCINFCVSERDGDPVLFLLKYHTIYQKLACTQKHVQLYTPKYIPYPHTNAYMSRNSTGKLKKQRLALRYKTAQEMSTVATLGKCWKNMMLE